MEQTNENVTPAAPAYPVVPMGSDYSIQREEPEMSSERKALVERWAKDIKNAKSFFEKDFERMDADMQVALQGAESDWLEGDNYTVPVVQRYINMAVASLYAKNPSAQMKRRKRLLYKLWDGTTRTLQDALSNPMDPNNMLLLQEIEQVRQQELLLTKIGRTLEVLFKYYTGEQEPNFKMLAKQMVRRAKVCGVGYIWVDFQRKLEPRPEITAKIEDITGKIAAMERMAADQKDGEFSPGAPELEEMRLALSDLQRQEMAVVREGPVFDFPRAKEIIPSKNCRQLQGFVGADWVARELHLSPDEVKEIYKIDIGKKYTPWTPDGKVVPDSAQEDEKAKAKACVWVVYNKKLRQCFALADGYPDFLQEPATPRVELEQFWPVIALVFNQIESESKLFPPSDVTMLRHPQRDINTSRQGLREHRRQNRPAYATHKGALEEEDRKKLKNHESGEVLELQALQPGQDVKTLLQPIQHAPIDPTLYDITPSMEDIYHTVGAQEANIGGTSGATATESTIAENSRVATVSSNIDDLDEFLSQVARCFAEICLLELSAETVVKIAGAGAVWPEWSRQEIVEELTLEIKAGSSGRPNQAADLAKMERAIPYLLQFPNINPTPIIEKYAELLDLDVEELLVEGAPSMQALNNMMVQQARAAMAPAPAMGNPAAEKRTPGAENPDAQGVQGGMNGQNPSARQPGPQPEFPGVAPF